MQMLHPFEPSPAAVWGCYLLIMDGWVGVVVVGIFLMPPQWLPCFHCFFSAFVGFPPHIRYLSRCHRGSLAAFLLWPRTWMMWRWQDREKNKQTRMDGQTDAKTIGHGEGMTVWLTDRPFDQPTNRPIAQPTDQPTDQLTFLRSTQSHVQNDQLFQSFSSMLSVILIRCRYLDGIVLGLTTPFHRRNSFSDRRITIILCV